METFLETSLPPASWRNFWKLNHSFFGGTTCSLHSSVRSGRAALVINGSVGGGQCIEQLLNDWEWARPELLRAAQSVLIGLSADDRLIRLVIVHVLAAKWWRERITIRYPCVAVATIPMDTISAWDPSSFPPCPPISRSVFLYLPLGRSHSPSGNKHAETSTGDSRLFKTKQQYFKCKSSEE